MDLIDPILSLASEIHTLVKNVKDNKDRCLYVSNRVETLEGPVRGIKELGAAQLKDKAMVEITLKDLRDTLQAAKKLIEKYTSANKVKLFFKSSIYGERFTIVNDHLNDASQTLCLALHVVNINKTPEQTGEAVDKSAVARIIEPKELQYETEPFMKTPASEVYKGELNRSTVAIKRYLNPQSISPEDLKRIFNKEVDTMKCFESPNILQIYGICIKNEQSPNPEFLIVMEYCEKGSLRQVLDNERDLPWTRKAQMCLDAARGLYRLHHTEKKSKVHGCLTSSNFLVDVGYRVKLGGLELATTETSLRRKSNDAEITSLCYCSPQMLSKNSYYTKECDIYSFGIVLWEIATGEKPFKGMSDDVIYQKVCKGDKEPLPDDCPPALAELIDACRAHDSFKRPTVVGVVNKLLRIVDCLAEAPGSSSASA
ncbi:mixed lineage kinase domain-like protein [Salarias fasciatus]|uniref:mixed lineage kinase domain-like protein n=1 Tax=Salarias fasciatus TaxID=181472 RepID=UPI001176DDA8|nr:mixed lineage kinase domain-like protein [Salarias fasciatus]